MRTKQIAKIVTDSLMTAILLLLMAYSLAGEATHEWLGISMFGLFVLHHILNCKWSRNLHKGRYTPFRVLQIIIVILVLFCMIGSMVSGIVLSRHALAFLPITGGQSWARILHMLSAYWGFTFMSIHLGLHWNMMLGMTKKVFNRPSKVRSWTARTIGLLIALYGAYAFVKREIGSYMLLKNPFVFFDFNEPMIYFLMDYAAIMALFVFVGHYSAEMLKKRN